MKKLLLVGLTLMVGCGSVGGSYEPRRPGPAPERSPADMLSAPIGDGAVFQTGYRYGTFLPETIPHGLGAKPRLFWVSIYSPGDENFTPMGELTADDTNLYLGATNSGTKYMLHAIR